MKLVSGGGCYSRRNSRRKGSFEDALTPASLPHAILNEKAFDNLFSRARLGLYQADTSGRLLPHAPRPHPHQLQPSPDGTLPSFLLADDRLAVFNSWKSALEAGLEWSRELRYHAPDGTVLRVQATVGQLRDDTGAISGFIGCNTDITAQVAARDELVQSEDRHRLAIEAASAGVWDLDVFGNQCYFSPLCFEMLGYTPGRLPGSISDWREIIHPDDLEVARRVKLECIDGTLPAFKVELRLRNSEGKWAWFLCNGQARRNLSGKAIRVVGTVTDISERKRVEQMLQVEHDLMDLITTASPVGILFMKSNGEIAFANPRAEQILGLSKDEMMQSGYGIPLSYIITGSDEGIGHLQDELPLREVLLNDNPLPHTCFAVKRPDGQRVLLSINAAPFVDSDGEAGGTVVIMEDVTEQKQHEQELADSGRLLRETQRIAQLGSYVLDLADDKWSCSDVLLQILGVEESTSLNLLGHFEIVHPDFRQQFIDSYLTAVMSSSGFEMEYKIIRQNDGLERWVAECCELRHDEGGRLSRLIGTIQDITERKAAEEAIRTLNDDLDRRVMERTSQLAAAKREIESFSYSVSHDLRAPLRHINSYSAILLEDHGASLPKEARQYLDRIRTASGRMGKLIDDLLTLTRVGRTNMKREHFDISQLAEDVANMLRETETGCTAEFVIQRGLYADGDSVLVRVVLQNLLGNSLKYAANKAARIEFGETVVDGVNAFFIRDNGVGFDMAYAGNLFQPFQRLHGSEFEGTGIGLATVRRVIERHRGSVWAEGKENVGATFYFTLAGAAIDEPESGSELSTQTSSSPAELQLLLPLSVVKSPAPRRILPAE